jgi:uncharacterized membrane protein HdeD (DUF308 family)
VWASWYSLETVVQPNVFRLLYRGIHRYRLPAAPKRLQSRKRRIPRPLVMTSGPPMTHTRPVPQPTGTWNTSWWQSILLGAVLILAGLFVLRNAVAATVASAIVFGIALVIAGLFEIVQSFWTPHWSGFFWRVLVGALYAIGGGALVADPLAASVLLTLAFAAALVASGSVRIFLALAHWERFGWLLLTSGVIGILAGLVILFKWPLSGLWVFGLVVGVDLLLHGFWWVVSGWNAREEVRPL